MRLIAGGMPPSKVAVELGVSRSRVSHIVKRERAERETEQS